MCYHVYYNVFKAKKVQSSSRRQSSSMCLGYAKNYKNFKCYKNLLAKRFYFKFRSSQKNKLEENWKKKGDNYQ